MNLNLQKSNEAGALSIELVFIVVMLVLIGIYIFTQLDAEAGNLVGNLTAADGNIETLADGKVERAEG